MTDSDEPRFEPIAPGQDVTKVPGYAWVEVDHHLVDREDGVYAIVPLRCLFIGKAGNIVNTPAVGLNVDAARQLAATLLANADAAVLEAKAACGDEQAAADYEVLRKQWGNDNLMRIYGN